MSTLIKLSRWKYMDETAFAVFGSDPVDAVRTATFLANQLPYDMILIACYGAEANLEWAEKGAGLFTYRIRQSHDWTTLTNKMKQVDRNNKVLLIVAGNHPLEFSEAIQEACTLCDFLIVTRAPELVSGTCTALPSYLMPRLGLSYLFSSTWSHDIYPLHLFGVRGSDIADLVHYTTACKNDPRYRFFYWVHASAKRMDKFYLEGGDKRSTCFLELPRKIWEFQQEHSRNDARKDARKDAQKDP